MNLAYARERGSIVRHADDQLLRDAVDKARLRKSRATAAKLSAELRTSRSCTPADIGHDDGHADAHHHQHQDHFNESKSLAIFPNW